MLMEAADDRRDGCEVLLLDPSADVLLEVAIGAVPPSVKPFVLLSLQIHDGTLLHVRWYLPSSFKGIIGVDEDELERWFARRRFVDVN